MADDGDRAGQCGAMPALGKNSSNRRRTGAGLGDQPQARGVGAALELVPYRQGRFFAGLPERGDVVVFHYPGQRDEDLVKRVIGLPGDTVAVRDGVVILNGRPLPRQRIADFAFPVTPNSPCRAPANTPGRTMRGEQGEALCVMPRFRESLPDGTAYDVLDQLTNGEADTFGPVTVPEGHVFVMGDNRDDSSDSRYPVAVGGVGMLPVDHLLGRVLVNFWSTDGSAEWIKPWTWFAAARWSRIGKTG